ncbi:hypothetical protein GCM10023083_69630 [Streptomyces phyllanthi]|uniref:hypothetical protein n=1 Tax=Streptomyces phyllanthi TaxID=1803180 RepID=UPI0031E8B458
MAAAIVKVPFWAIDLGTMAAIESTFFDTLSDPAGEDPEDPEADEPPHAAVDPIRATDPTIAAK